MLKILFRQLGLFTKENREHGQILYDRVLDMVVDQNPHFFRWSKIHLPYLVSPHKEILKSLKVDDGKEFLFRGNIMIEGGMEVVYLGMYQSPAGIIKAAIEEDADVIGVSYLSGEHLVYTPLIVEEMKKRGLDDVLLIAGGSFPPEDIPAMKEMGIDGVFRGGSLTREIVDYIKDKVCRKG